MRHDGDSAGQSYHQRPYGHVTDVRCMSSLPKRAYNREMISRRALTRNVLCNWPALLRGGAKPYEPGDLVKIVAVPDYCQEWKNSKSTALRRHAELLQRCVRRAYRVICVGEDGRPELDVFRTAALLDPDLRGCAISVEAECVSLVARRRALRRWTPPSWM